VLCAHIIMMMKKLVGAEQSVCVYFPVRVSSYPFGVRRTPGFYLVAVCHREPCSVCILFCLLGWL
jgi:hypothetical protein